MRTVMMMTLLIVGVPVVASAQDGGLRGARGHFVNVIDEDSREWQGRLLEVGAKTLTLEMGSDARQFEITRVKRVDAQGDRVWDGAIKGALFGGLIAAIVTDDARFLMQSAVAYGLVGIGLDALNSCQHTVYRARPSAAVKVSW